MAKLHQLRTFSSEKGNLTILENILPGTIQRVFYIYGVRGDARAGYRHNETSAALVCLSGSCRIYTHDGQAEKFYYLDNPNQCLVLEPQDWHLIDRFTDKAILLAIANQPYKRTEYVTEPYPNSRFAAVTV